MFKTCCLHDVKQSSADFYKAAAGRPSRWQIALDRYIGELAYAVASYNHALESAELVRRLSHLAPTPCAAAAHIRPPDRDR